MCFAGEKYRKVNVLKFSPQLLISLRPFFGGKIFVLCAVVCRSTPQAIVDPSETVESGNSAIEVFEGDRGWNSR
jgi:hypothetical protein